MREQVRIAIARIRRGNPAKSVLMVGLRGVGKTVLLDRMRLDAEGAGAYTLRIEAPENRSLPAMLAPQLRQVLLRLSRTQSAKKMAQRALRALAGNAKSYAERLFDYPTIGPLGPAEAEIAIVKPARDEGVDYSPKAVAEIVAATRG